MKRTNLGISVGLMGAAIYFVGFFSGYTAVLLLGGYVLLCEDNLWLKKTAVKAIVLMVTFSLFYAGINLVPDIISFVDSLVRFGGISFNLNVISNIINVILDATNIVEKVLFILLGTKSLSQGTISVPIVDEIVDKYMA